MIRSSLVIASTLIGFSNYAVADTCNAPDINNEYHLVFEDNFNGSGLDYGIWNTEFLWGPGVVINNEQQYYVNEGQFAYDPFVVSDGVLSIEAIKAPFDRSKLYLTRAIYSPNSAELLWRVPENAVEYQVYRDGVLQGVVSGGSYFDAQLREGIDYAYEVVALDSNNTQLVSAQLTINTADRPITTPDQLFSLNLQARIYSPFAIELLWNSVNRAGSVKIYRDGVLYRTLAGGDFKSLYEPDLISAKSYQYVVQVFDQCDELIIEEEIDVNTSSGVTPPPPAATRLVVASVIYSKFTAELSWNVVNGAVSYDIFENGAFVDNTDARSIFVDDLVAGIDRRYRVIALDFDGNEVDATSRVINTADNSFALNRQPFLSGIITSYDSFRFRYGRVEARARMPAGKGLWSAFWLLNAYYKQDQPADPEIDIIEAIGDQTTTANQAYHFQRDLDGDGFHTDRVSTELRSPISDFSSAFHTYSVDWTEGLIVWYVDGVETNRLEGSDVSSEQMYLIANLAVGGNFPGPPDETTQYPAKFEIDYIRVYQQ